jgi:DNA polymerase-3 subunit delta
MFLAVYGEDALRVRELSDDLLEKFVAKYDPSRLNVEIFDFSTTSQETLVPALQAAPFLSEKRFLFLKNVADTLKKADASFWLELFEALDPHTSLCFVDVLDEKAWKKSYLGVWLAKKSSEEVKYFSITPFSRSEAVSWIRARAQRFTVSLSESAATFLFARVGGESQELAVEIHKLASYAGDQPITEEMIEKLVPLRTSSDFFGFLDLLPTAEPDRLLRALAQETQAGTDAFGLFGGLLRQLRILAGVSLLLEQGIASQKEVADTLGVHPFVAQKALQGARAFSPLALREALEKATFWDKQTKLGVSAEVLVARLLEELLFARVKPLP